MCRNEKNVKHKVLPPFVPATAVEVNSDDAEDALQPSGDDPSPDELDEAVEDEDADLPTLGRPSSPFPPSDNGLPDPIIVAVPMEPRPDDSLRLPLDTLSLFVSQVIFPLPFPIKTDERIALEPEVATVIPPLRLSLSIEGVGEVGPPMCVAKDSPIAGFVPRLVCITDCNILKLYRTRRMQSLQAWLFSKLL